MSFRDEFLAPGDWIEAHTSGSTGAPKPIRLLKADMRASAEATCRFFGITEGSRLVCPLSTHYIAGKMMVVRAIVSGARLEMLAPSSSPLAGWQGECDIDLLPVVPPQVEALLADARLPRVKNLLVGGGRLGGGLARSLAAAGVAAWESYGMTETCSHVALRKLGAEAFEALPGISFATDGRGCLVVDIPAMSIGRVVTNDVVRLIDSLHFEWLGRFDNVINSGGVKIHPEIDEKILAPLLPRTTFYITSRPSRRWGEEAVMVVVESDLADEAILGVCKQALPPHHVPKAIVRDAAPRYTASGKLIRQKL